MSRISEFAFICLMGLCILGLIGFIYFVTVYKTEHQRRMELIEEKQALIHLQRYIEIKENQHFIDSMYNEIDKEFK